MANSRKPAQEPFIIEKTQPGVYTIRFYEKIDTLTADAVIKRIRTLKKNNASFSLVVDIGDITNFDDFSAITLLEIKQQIDGPNNDFKIIHVNTDAADILSNINFNTCEIPPPLKQKEKSNFIFQLGESTITHGINVRFMVSFLGSVILSFFRVITHPGSLRINDTISSMEKTGVNAVPIIALISFLLGLVIAFMSSLQLQQFGANLYVASLVSIAMVSELGPIMTAIVVAGRSGSAFAAEIGSMKISEEIDALVIMGFDPAHFLALPRIISAVVVVPILTLFSDLFAVMGGLVVGVFMLNLTAGSYISQTIKTLTLFEVTWGLTKSIIFAVLIAWIGCLRGFQTQGGASAVGDAATSAVVTSIFFIILFDSFFAIVRSYWL